MNKLIHTLQMALAAVLIGFLLVRLIHTIWKHRM